MWQATIEKNTAAPLLLFTDTNNFLEDGNELLEFFLRDLATTEASTGRAAYLYDFSAQIAAGDPEVPPQTPPEVPTPTPTTVPPPDHSPDPNSAPPVKA
jgi:hypothetical protein